MRAATKQVLSLLKKDLALRTTMPVIISTTMTPLIQRRSAKIAVRGTKHVRIKMRISEALLVGARTPVLMTLTTVTLTRSKADHVSVINLASNLKALLLRITLVLAYMLVVAAPLTLPKENASAITRAMNVKTVSEAWGTRLFVSLCSNRLGLGMVGEISMLSALVD